MPDIKDIAIKALLVGAIFLAGYATAWHYGRENLKAYQYEVMVQGETQKAVNQEIIQRQDKVISDVKTDYQKRLAAINATTFGSLQRNTSGSSMPANFGEQDTSGVVSYSSDFLPPTEVLAKQCAITTNQLVSLIDIIKRNQLKDQQ